jgi:RNA polymerase sigma-70 factor (ECF subfamily)
VSLVTTTHTTLLSRLATGTDGAAWSEFWDRYGELIHRYARRRGLQPADADEVTQDVLVALSRAMPGFTYDPARGKFRSYLKTIVARAIRRKNDQKRGQVLLEDIEAAAGAPPAADAVDDEWELEWRRYHLRLGMRKVELEFSRLDVAAFQAYAVAGRDSRETAEALGMSVDQVYQAKSRILKRLGELIATQIEEEG